MIKLFLSILVCAIVLLPGVSRADEPTLTIGYAKCAQCAPISLLPEYAKNVKIKVLQFNTGNDVLTALVSKSIDVAQISYLHYINALDKGFDVVAISGHISGGSQCLSSNSLGLAATDWSELKRIVTAHKQKGTPLRIVSSRGSAQDLEMRGEFSKHGIDVNRDLSYISIPTYSDHVQALARDQADIVCTTEPYGSQILQMKLGKFFVYPYDQAAGKLTNMVFTRSDIVADKPAALEELVRSVVNVDLAMASNKPLFVSTIQKITGIDKAVAEQAVTNLYPDPNLYRMPAIAIGSMMRDLHYTSTDVTEKVNKTMNYRFLEAVTGKPKTELGYK